MERYAISGETIKRFRDYLFEQEKSENTIKKYIRDVVAFSEFCTGVITKETVVEYKQNLINQGYTVRSINSMLSSINSLFSFLGWNELHVKSLKIQQDVFRSDDKELTRIEYERLCHTAEKNGNERLSLIIQTICGTGIRVGELEFITVEAVKKGEATVSLKGKTRRVFIVRNLQNKLLQYISEQNISTGAIFVTNTGKSMNRTNIWREMKSLCIEAEVNPEKVYPHNLRHLFAQTFYNVDKDIVKLADVLGHSSINTTRIYIVSTGEEHRRCMERMQLIL